MSDLGQHKAEAKAAKKNIDTTITHLLQENRISPLMASSLLNDFNYSHKTAKNLLDFATALLSTHDELIAEAAEETNLDEVD